MCCSAAVSSVGTSDLCARKLTRAKRDAVSKMVIKYSCPVLALGLNGPQTSENMLYSLSVACSACFCRAIMFFPSMYPVNVSFRNILCTEFRKIESGWCFAIWSWLCG